MSKPFTTARGPFGKIRIEEDERQLILLGLARLATQNPGFGDKISGLAGKLKGEKLYSEFLRVNANLDHHNWLLSGYLPDDIEDQT